MDIKQRLAHDLDRHTLTLLSGDELRELRRDALAEIERLESLSGGDIRGDLEMMETLDNRVELITQSVKYMCRRALAEIRRLDKIASDR
jgi:hypothetical protein